eukprot:comp21229_c0_seq1/m.28893 comp21229_c0_seq1/g.28893  ORF comp21229_c0_seq1/g.28893 comp21229_c0_seq1/m.28893 type:complete len:239 (-) comp21229_c0_seq1:515-1231(-)
MEFSIRKNTCEYHGVLGLPLGAFVQRVMVKAGMTKGKFLVGLIYAHRTNEAAESAKANHNTPCSNVHLDLPECPHCMFLTTCVLAQKYMDDVTHTNRWWAQTGGVSLRTLNRMERDVLSILSFDLNVSPETFQKWIESYQAIKDNGYKLVLVALRMQIFSTKPAITENVEPAAAQLQPTKTTDTCAEDDSCAVVEDATDLGVLTPPATPLPSRPRYERRVSRRGTVPQPYSRSISVPA